MKLSKRELHSMPGTLSDLHGERPEAATQHAPATAGALLDAHASLLRAASATGMLCARTAPCGTNCVPRSTDHFRFPLSVTI